MISFACKQFEINDVIKCGFGMSKADFKVMYFMIDYDEDWFTTDELAKKLKLNLSTIQRSVKKLHEQGVVIRNQNNLQSGGYVFNYKIKDKKQLRELIKGIIQSWVKKVNMELDSW